MKKLAVGCGVLLVLGLAGSAAVSYVVYRKVTRTVTGFAELGSLPALEQSIRKQGPYSPPASGEPSISQVEGLLEVQQAVRARLGERADEIERRYRRFLGTDSATALDLPELVSAYRDLAVAYVDAKRAQVDALNRAGLSLDEYRWTRSQSYAALGMPLPDVDVGRIFDAIREGRQPATEAVRLSEGPASPALQQLLEPHRKTLEENAGLAFFGL